MVKTKRRGNTQSVSRSRVRSTPFVTQPSEDRPRHHELIHPPNPSAPPDSRIAIVPTRENSLLHSFYHRALSRAHRAPHRVVTIHPVKTQRVIIRARKHVPLAREQSSRISAWPSARRVNRIVKFHSSVLARISSFARLARVSRRRWTTISASSFATSLRVSSAIRAFGFPSTYRAARRRAKGDGGLRRGKHILSIRVCAFRVGRARVTVASSRRDGLEHAFAGGSADAPFRSATYRMYKQFEDTYSLSHKRSHRVRVHWRRWPSRHSLKARAGVFTNARRRDEDDDGEHG